MAGTFEGLSDLEWKLFADLLPPAPTKRGRGMPHTPLRNVVNTLCYVLITGCRWCDLRRGPQWASKSAAHRCCSAGRPTGRWLPCKRASSGLLRNVG
jgi:transposase